MSYSRAYTSKINWKNADEASSTPVNASNLGRGDSALFVHDEELEDHDIKLEQLIPDVKQAKTDIAELKVVKANQEDMLLTVKNIYWNEESQTLSFYRTNGALVQKIDFYTEKLPVKFWFNGPILWMESTDGTRSSVDLSYLIDTIDFEDSSQIKFNVIDRKHNVRKVTAEILDGSITANKLQPNFLADVTAQADRAEGEADKAATSAEEAAESARKAKESEIICEEDVQVIVDGSAVTGVKGNAEERYHKGAVNITYEMIGVNPPETGGTGQDTLEKAAEAILRELPDEDSTKEVISTDKVIIYKNNEGRFVAPTLDEYNEQTRITNSEIDILFTEIFG